MTWHAPPSSGQPALYSRSEAHRRHRHRMANLTARYVDLLQVPRQIEATLLRRFERERDAELERYQQELWRSA